MVYGLVVWRPFMNDVPNLSAFQYVAIIAEGQFNLVAGMKSVD